MQLTGDKVYIVRYRETQHNNINIQIPVTKGHTKRQKEDKTWIIPLYLKGQGLFGAI